MEDKKDVFFDFIEKQIRKYQSKRKMPLSEEDIKAIIEVVKIFITHEIENRSGFHSTLSNIVENTIIDSRVKMSDIVAELSMPDLSKKDTLRELKKASKYKTTIKKSPLLREIRNSKGYTSDELLENIPAIDCFIKPHSLSLIGYGINGDETIFEINQKDERPSTREIDLISTKEALEIYNGTSKSVK